MRVLPDKMKEPEACRHQESSSSSTAGGKPAYRGSMHSSGEVVNVLWQDEHLQWFNHLQLIKKE
jgi:hypothetical protein